MRGKASKGKRGIKIMRKKRGEAKANGMCRHCAYRPAALPKLACEICLEKDRKKAKERYHRSAEARRKLGLCSKCSNLAMKGYSRCGKCSEEDSARHCARAKEASKKGICPQCRKNKKEPGRFRCKSCLEYQAKHQKERRNSGTANNQGRAAKT